MSEAYNELARAFLVERGFNCELEPEWVAGRKPDFFCTGRLNLWVEVKFLAEEARHLDLFRIFDYLRRHQSRVTGRGFGIAYTAQTAETKDAKVALGLANGALSRPEASSHRAVWVIVPEAPIYGKSVSFTMNTKDGPVWIVSSKSATGKYGYPFYLEPEPWDQRVAIRDNGGEVTTYDLNQIAEEERYRFALAVHPDVEPFRLLSTGPAGGAQHSMNRERIRGAVSQAVNQLKSGLKERAAPACVFIYQSGALVPEDIQILSALLGDLAYVFHPSDFQTGTTRFAGNAAWQEKKNTSVSAVTFFRNAGTPTTFHNPFAIRPVPPGIFGFREWFTEAKSGEFTCRVVDASLPESRSLP